MKRPVFSLKNARL